VTESDQLPDAWESPQQILVILAHPDDPEFFCGATLANGLLLGITLHMVYLHVAIKAPKIET
jgi:LmbE family N-acetylglucosaminyl deacetylase